MNIDIDRPTVQMIFGIWLYMVYIWRVCIAGFALKRLPIDSPRSLDELKKNPIETYFFIMEKNDFEKKSRKKNREISIFSIEKSIFSSK